VYISASIFATNIGEGPVSTVEVPNNLFIYFKQIRYYLVMIKIFAKDLSMDGMEGRNLKKDDSKKPK
jgi:hypothetical protein